MREGGREGGRKGGEEGDVRTNGEELDDRVQAGLLFVLPPVDDVEDDDGLEHGQGKDEGAPGGGEEDGQEEEEEGGIEKEGGAAGEFAQGFEEGEVPRGGGVGREGGLGEGGMEEGTVEIRARKMANASIQIREGEREGRREGEYSYELFACAEFLGWLSLYIGLARFLGHSAGGAEEVEGEVFAPPAGDTQSLTKLACGGEEGGRERTERREWRMKER